MSRLICRAHDFRYKYRLDADGYGWSARWKKELSTNCVVIKINAYVSEQPRPGSLHENKTWADRDVHSPNGGPGVSGGRLYYKRAHTGRRS